jgi:hypothetical protein
MAALFRLARTAGSRLLSLRFMQFSVRKFVAFSACASLLVICSCEKHRVGEMPEAQKEQPDPAAVREKEPRAESEKSALPTPSAKPTPAEFFPESTPR